MSGGELVVGEVVDRVELPSGGYAILRDPKSIRARDRKEAMRAASDFLQRKFPVVTVVADGRVYTIEEFAKTMVDVEAA